MSSRRIPIACSPERHIPDKMQLVLKCPTALGDVFDPRFRSLVAVSLAICWAAPGQLNASFRVGVRTCSSLITCLPWLVSSWIAQTGIRSAPIVRTTLMRIKSIWTGTSVSLARSCRARYLMMAASPWMPMRVVGLVVIVTRPSARCRAHGNSHKCRRHGDVRLRVQQFLVWPLFRCAAAGSAGYLA